jgi:ABC-type amino acid transport substrate-binding protein
MSTPQLARLAGVLYLIVAIFGGFAHLFVRATVYLPGDAAGTAQSVLANAGLVRVGVVADLLQATVFLFLGMTLYLLLSHVNPNAARVMVILVAVATTIICLNIVFQFAALLVATDASYAAAFGAAGANALVLLLLDIQHYGYLIAQIFFGLWLVPLGYLAYRSGMFPRALGVVLIVGAIGYLVDMLRAFLIPGVGEAIFALVVIPSAIGELWMVGYLLVKGAGVARPDRPASASIQARAASAN